jgi:hypothetical protein
MAQLVLELIIYDLNRIIVFVEISTAVQCSDLSAIYVRAGLSIESKLMSQQCSMIDI